MKMYRVVEQLAMKLHDTGLQYTVSINVMFVYILKLKLFYYFYVPCNFILPFWIYNDSNNLKGCSIFINTHKDILFFIANREENTI